MNKQYATALLLAFCVASTLECKSSTNVKEKISEIAHKVKTGETKEEKKKRTDREAFAMNATGAIIGAMCFRSAHRFPQGGFRRNNPLFTESRVESAGTAAVVSGLVSSLLYKLWKTDESITRITARQALNCFGVSLVSNIGFGFIGL